jgi:glycosyltransferase involved in cell wall biosynthesis
MLSLRFYYALKPFVPWRVRMALRRISARRKRKIYEASWPINESTSRPPLGWPGWPDGKKFAFVVTHDVEGPAGVAKCRQLAELEMSLGFRSCFNFIPEGSYRVPAELRAWLTENGFEVGVHDLNHDGKLFDSQSGFLAKAKRINHYLREWKAGGYRSGFMLRNLDWLHELTVNYDSSTFDTDPFEPQPDGAGTIFPYWIPAPQPATPPGGGDTARSQGGYVELPYTLPQDSTLYLLLREKKPEIWLRKLEWIASHGGMALVNVHPDYLQFPGEPDSDRTYPVSHYVELLNRVRADIPAGCWHALPGKIAEFVAGQSPKPTIRASKRIGMITHSFYEVDNRVTRYAEALAARGDQVDVLALRRSPALPRQEMIEGVRLTRLQDRFGKTERSMLSFLLPSLRFLWASSWWMVREHRRERFALLHVHNIPDFLVFAAWYPKLTGVKVMLDIHDIVPEFFSSKFGPDKKWIITLLRLMERLSGRFANHVIIANHLWLDLYAKRTGMEGRCTVFINNVNSRVFRPGLRTRPKDDGKLIVLFPGGLQWHQGLDIALRAFVRVSRELPQAEFHIYGDGNMKPALVQLASELGLGATVRFFEPVRITEIAQVMANGDLGVVPKRADSFGNQAYSTKIMEFMSVGVPVVVSRTMIDQFYFNDSVVRFFASGDAEALADAMLAVLRDPLLREHLTKNALAYAQQHSWESRRGEYLQLIDATCCGETH